MNVQKRRRRYYPEPSDIRIRLRETNRGGVRVLFKSLYLHPVQPVIHNAAFISAAEVPLRR